MMLEFLIQFAEVHSAKGNMPDIIVKVIINSV